MRTRKVILWLGVLLAAMLALGGCQTASPETTATATVAPSTQAASPTDKPTIEIETIPTATSILEIERPLPSAFEGSLPDGVASILGTGTINGYALSPHGVYFALLSGIGIYIYYADTFELRWYATLYGDTYTDFKQNVLWSPDGSKIAVKTQAMVWVFDVISGDHLAFLNSKSFDQSIYARWEKVGWTQDSQTIGMVWTDNLVTWDARSNGVVSRSTMDRTSFDWAPDELPSDGVLADGRSVRITYEWDILRIVSSDTDEVLHQWVTSPAIEYVKWSPDGSTAAIKSRFYPPETVTWNVATGAPIARVEEASLPDYVKVGEPRVALSPDGTKQLSIYYCPLELTIFDVATNQITLKAPLPDCCEGPCVPMIWSPDSRLMFAESDGMFYAWSAQTGEVVAMQMGPGYGEFLGFSLDGRLLAIEAHGLVVLWKVPQ